MDQRSRVARAASRHRRSGPYRQAIEIATVPVPPRRAAGIVYVGMAEVAYQWGELSNFRDRRR